jgi:hypothetical protein
MKTALKRKREMEEVVGTTYWFERLFARPRRRRRKATTEVAVREPGWFDGAWVEARVIFRASLILTAGAWLRRVFEQLLDTKVFNESIVNREWNDVIRNVEIDVTHEDRKGEP